MKHFQQFLNRRGIVLVISDFYEQPETIVKAIEPLRFHGSEVVLFHMLDPKEIYPELKGPAMLVDLETDQRLEVIPEYVKTQYRAKMDRASGRDARAHAGGGDGVSPADDGQAAGPGADGVSVVAAVGVAGRRRQSAGRRVMGFLAPWFLAGMLAVGLPVFVHLLRKQTTVPRPVSSLMFFEQGKQSSMRHRRLRYLLLFALRTALVLLLALAFARPFFRHKTVLASDKLLLVAVDDSFSMNAAAGGGTAGTRLDEAKRGALEVLAGKRPGQKAQVIELGGQMRLLTQPVEDADELRAAVQGIQPGDGHGNFGELGRGMRAMAETVHTPMELAPVQRYAGIEHAGELRRHGDAGQCDAGAASVGEAKVPNWTVESVQAPGQLVDTKKARVIAVIAGHETPAATRTVSLVVNGAVIATKKVDVPADGRATVVFEGLDVPYGESRCAVRIDGADGFPNDDASSFAVKRADPERVLFVHQAWRYAVAAVLWCGAGGGGAGVVCAAADYAGGGERTSIRRSMRLWCCRMCRRCRRSWSIRWSGMWRTAAACWWRRGWRSRIASIFRCMAGMWRMGISTRAGLPRMPASRRWEWPMRRIRR